MDLLSKKYRQAEEISNLKAENARLITCLQEIKAIAKDTIKTTGMISAGFILQKITEAEEE